LTTASPTAHISNNWSRLASSNVRRSQRGHDEHFRNSLMAKGRGKSSRIQLQGRALAMKQCGCGMERVGVSQWQVTNLSASFRMGALPACRQNSSRPAFGNRLKQP
jgi:hypothetical protein